MEFQKEVLGNGIRLIYFPMPNLRSASAIVGVGAGTRHEDSSKQGIAHFSEHMSFKALPSLSGGETVFDMFKDLGSSANATTLRESTHFLAQSPALYLGKGLEILVDMVFNPVLTDRLVRVEAEAITREIRGYRDDPGDQVANLFNRVVFGADHPMGWGVLGTVETVAAIAADDIREFRRCWYTTDNIVVGMAGKFEDRLIDGLRQRLESVEASRAGGSPQVFSSTQCFPQIAVEGRYTEQAYIVLGFRSYDENHPNVRVLQVLEEVFSSRIFSNIRERLGLVHGIAANAFFMSDCGTFEIEAVLDREDLKDVLLILMDELDRFRNDLVPASQLQRAKVSLRGSTDIGMESTAQVCSFFINQEISGVRIETPEEMVAAFDAATAQDIRDAAQEIFVESGLNLAVVGPDLKEDEIKEMLTVG